MVIRKFNNMLEINISRNSPQRNLGVLGGAFQGFGCPKGHPDALLAKTMMDGHLQGNGVMVRPEVCCDG